MGIHVTFIRLSEEKLGEIFDNEKKIEEFLIEQDRIKDNPQELWIEKSWEGIHYLIYEKRWLYRKSKDIEFGTLLEGRILCDKIDTGYGFPMYQTPEEVKKITKDLQKFTKEELTKKYNPKIFIELEIYPSRKDWIKEDINYLLGYWEDLVKFYNKAVLENEFVIFYFH